MEIGAVVVVDVEVQDTDYVDSLQGVVPVSSFRLFPDGEGSIIQAPVLEKLLFRLLHLYQNLFSLFVFTIHIEHGFPVQFPGTQVFGIQVSQVFHHFLSVEKGVDEAYQQFLVHFCPEQLLESEVGVRVYVSGSLVVIVHGRSLYVNSILTNIGVFLQSSKYRLLYPPGIRMRFDRKIGYRLRNERILPEMLNGYAPEYALTLVNSYGTKAWQKVSGSMGNRTDVQCRYRYQLLKNR